MKSQLTVFSLLVLVVLIAVSIWATGHVSIVPAIQDLLDNPAREYNAWFVATLADAYFGFLWFYLWIAYKESRWVIRILWLPLILTLGNMAMAAYMLVQLYKLPKNPTAADLLLRRPA